MNERRMEFLVGVMFLAGLIVTVIVVTLSNDARSVFKSKNRFCIEFDEAPGVTQSTPVHKNGILIGRVSGIQFIDNDTKVLVTVDIDAKYKLYQNEICRVTSALLVGNASLDFVRSPDRNASPDLLKPGSTIQGVVAKDASQAIVDLQLGLSQTIRSVNEVSANMNTVLGRVDRLLRTNEDHISSTIRQADDTLKLLQETLRNSNDLLGDSKFRNDIRQTVKQMPAVLDKTRAMIEDMGDSIKSLDRNLHNIEEVTSPLGDNGKAIVGRIDSSSQKLDQLMDRMLRFSDDLNNPEGSLGQLMRDPDLYQHVKRTVSNIDEITRELKPVINDARVFSDKIARHPEMLGVRGAIERSPGLK